MNKEDEEKNPSFPRDELRPTVALSADRSERGPERIWVDPQDGRSHVIDLEGGKGASYFRGLGWWEYVKAEGWQPIETAPLNESVLIFIPNPIAEHYGPAVYRGLQKEPVGHRVWMVTGLHFGSDVAGVNSPSHWMPLPAPPISTQDEGS